MSDQPPQSFVECFDELLEIALRLAARLVGPGPEAEDAAAETMVRALLHWRRIGDEPWRTAWIVRVATNVSLDLLRRSSRQASYRVTQGLGVEESVVMRQALVAALARLPGRQRQAIAMRYLGDQSEADVASALGISPVTVRTHLRRGLTALRLSLGPTWEETLHA